MVCQVKFAEWTRDERLRQPVFLGLREDKDAKELVRESFMLWQPTCEMGNLLRRGQRHRRISANVARSDNVPRISPTQGS